MRRIPSMPFLPIAAETPRRIAAPLALLAFSAAIVACGTSGEAPQPDGAAAPDEPSATTGPTPQPTPPAQAAFPPLEPDPPLQVPAVPVPGPQPVQDVALDGLQAAVEQNPDDANAHRQLAIALFRSGRRGESLEHFERAAELGPTTERLMDLAGAYGFAGRLEDAEATYEQVLSRSPTHPTALYNLGNVLLMQGELDAAIDRYNQAIEQQPEYLLAWFQLAVAHKTRGDQARDDYRESYKAFGKVLEFDAANADEARAGDNALYEMASMDVMMGAHQRAEEMLRTLLEVNADHPNAHYALAQLLMRQGRVEEAQAELAAHQAVRDKFSPSGQVATGQ